MSPHLPLEIYLPPKYPSTSLTFSSRMIRVNYLLIPPDEIIQPHAEALVAIDEGTRVRVADSHTQHHRFRFRDAEKVAGGVRVVGWRALDTASQPEGVRRETQALRERAEVEY